MARGLIGIVVSGGPAPGINSVISAAVKEAHNLGYRVKGLKNGFRAVSEGKSDAFIPLGLENTQRIARTGGSILGTSRFNPFSRNETKERFAQSLHEQGIDRLIVIGGEGSAWVSYRISQEIAGLQVIHVPKTIDNDLILPNKHPSFGFETARYVGTNILNTLMVDAQTCERWFLVTSMGRKAGFLALGLGITSGASITLIPEEFAKKKPTVRDVATIILGSIKKSLKEGIPYGMAIIAEGILDELDSSTSEELEHCPRDEMGRIRYSLLDIAEVILPVLREECRREGLDIKFNTKNIGYELRCHDPVAFDIEYTTILGFGAVQGLDRGLSGVMVTKDFDNLGYQPLSEMIQEDGSVRSRRVDLNSDLYDISRSFMVR